MPQKKTQKVNKSSPKNVRKTSKTRKPKKPSELIDFADLKKLSKKLKKQNKKIVFTLGSFSLLNPGHCRYLAEAKARGDILVVGISSDSSDARNKGQIFPLLAEQIRAELVSYLEVVDYVTIVDEDRPHASLIMLEPDIFFTSSHAWEQGIRGDQDKAIVKSFDGKISTRKDAKPYYNASALVEHIASIRVTQILENFLKEKFPGFDMDSEDHLKPVDFGKQIPNNSKAFRADKRIIPFEDLENLGVSIRTLPKGKRKKPKIVFVSGSYDLLHVGHARFIRQASLQGDILVVGIPSDRSLRKLKGIGRPVITEYSRAYTLASLEFVDYVTIFDDATVLNSLEKLKPDVFYSVNESWNGGYKQSPEYKLVTSYKGKVVLGDRQSPNLSASAIIDRAAHEKVKEIFSECMDEERYEKLLAEKSRFQD